MIYNFRRLVKKYSKTFTLVTHEAGMYVGGRYVEGDETVKAMTGAIIPLSQRKIYQSGGTLSTTDRQLYTLERISESLKGSQVIYKGRTYSIEEDTDYTDYSEVSVYVLRWVDNDN